MVATDDQGISRQRFLQGRSRTKDRLQRVRVWHHAESAHQEPLRRQYTNQEIEGFRGKRYSNRRRTWTSRWSATTDTVSRAVSILRYLHYSGHQAAGGSKAPPVLDFLGVAALLPGINVNNNNTHYNSP